MNHSELKAIGASVGYGDKIVVPNIDVEILQGKISVIIGANGCGKSTLLKAFCRLNKVSSGEILLDSKSINCYSARSYAKKVGLLTQSPIVPEGISVIELVSRGRFPYRKTFKGMTDEDYMSIDDAMEKTGITDLADRNVDELSGGQRQRVWIALALAQKTDILFLDEPTTYLDITYQIEILELLAKLNRESGTTIVMVLHDINQALRYADCILAMKEGKLLACGAPKEIINEKLIYDVYGLNSHIIEDPVYKTPYVIPLAG